MNSVGDSDGGETTKLPDNTDHLKPHTCNRCGKRFASGSALGGHRTVHGPNTTRLSSGAAEASIACSVCGATFRSWKSVYGHMHVHRHRGWRGMHPPSTALPTSPSSSTISDISGELRDKAPVETTESVHNTARLMSTKVVRRNLKTRRLADLELEPEPAGAAVAKRSHVCRICGVSFPTHHSLGGHVAAHNRKKNIDICSNRSRKNKKASDDKEDRTIRGCRVKKIQCAAGRKPTEAAAVSAVKFDLNELPPMEDDDEAI